MESHEQNSPGVFVIIWCSHSRL